MIHLYHGGRPRRRVKAMQSALVGTALIVVAAASAGQQPQPLASLTGQGGEVTCLGFTPDGKALFSGSIDSYITVWTTKDWKHAITIEPAPPPKAEPGEHQDEFRSLTACATAATTNTLRIASGGDSITSYSLPSGKILGNQRSDANDGSLAVSPDDSVVAVGAGSTVSFFAVGDWEKLDAISIRGNASTLRYAPRGRLLAVAIERGGIQLWDTKTGSLVQSWSEDGNSEQISFSPDGRLLAAGVWGTNKPNHVQVWDVATGLRVTSLDGHKDTVWGVAFSPDGKYLVSGDTSGLIRLWRVADWKSCAQVKASGVYQVAISPNGRWLAAGGGTLDVAIWDFRTLLRSCTDDTAYPFHARK